MLHYLVEQLTYIAVTLTETLGYWGIFIGMTIESSCIPLPSEAIMLFSGFMVAAGLLNFWVVVTAGVLGNLMGSVLTYWFGASGGRALLLKYGRYILINAEHLEKSERWFNRYGEWTVFFTRNLPVIRTFISLPAGIARMNFAKFFIYTLVGCIPWNTALTYLGFKLGENWQLIEPYFRPVSYAILAALIAVIVWFVYKSLRSRKKPLENN
ncbi:MAG: DedA family protein [Desulfotomaculaceae bacterium]|nr:DedA family protein [Desulfotomaculaceae bacterium]